MIFCLKYIISALFILNFISCVLCIKCWNCRSNNDPKCADPFDNSTVPITDCDQERGLPHLPGVRPSMCRKIRQKVNGEWRYFRDCAYLGEQRYALGQPVEVYYAVGPNTSLIEELNVRATRWCFGNHTCRGDGPPLWVWSGVPCGFFLLLSKKIKCQASSFRG
ncbi:unnamed protein product, partial [Brenthis ino]